MTTTEPEAATRAGAPAAPGSAPAVAVDAGARRPRVLRRGGRGGGNGDGAPVARLTWRRALRRDWQLYTFLIVPLVFLLVFRYLPMAGNIIAFRRFRPGSSIFGDEWVGLYYFEAFITNQQFWSVFWNTVILGGLTLAICFPLPIVLALMLNELRSRRYKRLVQTISYLPHFMSIVIVAGLVMQLTAVNGTVNQIVEAFGGDAVSFMQRPDWFRSIYVSSEVWQTVGWGTILYLAALTTIDQQLYEAARIDGANRWKQTWHITLPGIRPTMMVLLILNIGSFMAVGFEKVLLLQNPLIYSTADVISTYLYRVGIQSAQFSYGTAIGLFEALIGLVLVLTANGISRRVTGASLW
ncbi:ABC transporter permease [Litorihabitans aurantiacus]|uniref:Sugar ABC transporter permease n=1 Tax=Litorihabitans aurantiacus TaxID=1930061 RepID=A0AA37XH57_9MICO|nr:ABC transporter permease subunit [Litorihabitans aurantiacus]GMA33257.1 sugar ABC transporter permease [Litorihabitans aurantiacus]